MKCPECTKEVAGDSPSCPSCGASLDEESFAPTRIMSDASGSGSAGESARGRKSATPRTSASTSSLHDSSIDNSRFVAGTMLGERYRIVGLLGRGGMGEVYRAEDLKLGQAVALKLLPETLSMDGAALARFHREVRVARQISHRNVCRVYDIGEDEGLHFLSMEYIRGEELSSVIKRFGRLPADKAAEIARQICAGLAAAHDAGVLHRDLKPGNIMIDENGNPRIMDFGLAGLTEEFRGEQVIEGTPEYMSPEQLAGRELTPKSDIYSLGLVLYELFTGRKAFTANTLPELIRLRKSETLPESPSVFVRDIDPLVERVVERCLATDPKDRPSSALQVAAALPGGDPLAAALAAGETPSPEMVAAAHKEGSLRPAVALALLVGTLVAMALAVFLSGKLMLHRRVPLEKSAQGLKERAGEVARKLGYDAASDYAYGFHADVEYLENIKQNDDSPARWEQLKSGRPVALSFWYRQSPRPLVPLSAKSGVSQVDPPRVISNMSGMRLDTRGRLLYFYGVPPQVIESTTTQSQATPFDWAVLFKEAELDPSGFKPTAPQWTPPHAFDAHEAWEGVYPERPDIPVRIEAASYRGRPVYFQIVNSWNKPMRQQEVELNRSEHITEALLITIFLVILLGAALLARRNLRLGRGDRRGAFRLAGFTFVVGQVAWLASEHHVPSLSGEFGLFVENLAYSLLICGMLWLVYIAIEPFVRRRWPTRVISWNRLLVGDWRDPLVGRDILIGALFGAGLMVLGFAEILTPQWLGWSAPTPPSSALQGLNGGQHLVGMFAAQIINSLIAPAAIFFLLLLFSIITRREWAAIAVVWLLFAALFAANGDHPVIDWPFGALNAALTLIILLRFGMVAMIFSQFFALAFTFYPITSDFSVWYAGGTIFALAVAAAVAAYGFYTSLAGQPLFHGALADD